MGTVWKPVDPSKFIVRGNSLERLSSGLKYAMWLGAIFRKEESGSRDRGEGLLNDAPKNVADWFGSLSARIG
jgi:hypothetical protein